LRDRLTLQFCADAIVVPEAFDGRLHVVPDHRRDKKFADLLSSAYQLSNAAPHQSSSMADERCQPSAPAVATPRWLPRAGCRDGLTEEFRFKASYL